MIFAPKGDDLLDVGWHGAFSDSLPTDILRRACFAVRWKPLHLKCHSQPFGSLFNVQAIQVGKMEVIILIINGPNKTIVVLV